MCVKKFENTSLVRGCDGDLESSDKPTQVPAVEPDFLQEQAVLFDFLPKTVDSDDSTGSTQENLSLFNLKIVDGTFRIKSKQKNKTIMWYG